MQTAQRLSRLPDVSGTISLVVVGTTVQGLVKASDKQYDGWVPVEWGLPRKVWYVPKGYALIGCCDCNEAYALPEERVVNHRRVRAAVTDEKGASEYFFDCGQH